MLYQHTADALFQIGMSLKSICSRASVGAATNKHTPSAVSFIFGTYKGTKVAIRGIQCGPLALTRDNLVELKTVRDNVLYNLKELLASCAILLLSNSNTYR